MWIQLPAWTMVGVAMTLYTVSIEVSFDKYHACIGAFNYLTVKCR